MELPGLDLAGQKLDGLNFKKTNLDSGRFCETSFSGANLEEANLRGANLDGADLKGANLKGANLKGAWFVRADLRKAIVGGASFQNVLFLGANLQGVNLEEANLEEASLGRANLEGANLERANLREANLEEADLRGANLEGANLEEASVGKTILDKEYKGYRRKKVAKWAAVAIGLIGALSFYGKKMSDIKFEIDRLKKETEQQEKLKTDSLEREKKSEQFQRELQKYQIGRLENDLENERRRHEEDFAAVDSCLHSLARGDTKGTSYDVCAYRRKPLPGVDHCADRRIDYRCQDGIIPENVAKFPDCKMKCKDHSQPTPSKRTKGKY